MLVVQDDVETRRTNYKQFARRTVIWSYGETVRVKVGKIVDAANKVCVKPRGGYNEDSDLASGIRRVERLRQPRNAEGTIDPSRTAQKKHKKKKSVTLFRHSIG